MPPGNRRRISEQVRRTQFRPPPILAAMGEPGAVGNGIDLSAVLGVLDAAVEALAEARKEIDALNVYPVPDGDTGTNMYLTLAAARDAAEDAVRSGTASPQQIFDAVSRGALLGARGNSGVILSEMTRAVLTRLASAGPAEWPGTVLADALSKAQEASYAAVGTPVEGTMLSVCKAAAQAAQALLVRDPEARSRDVVIASAGAAREALARTPEQLRVLADSGVVDAGGRGLVVIFDAAQSVIAGQPPRGLGGRRVEPRSPQRTGARPDQRRENTAAPGVPGADLVDGGPAYEVMYLLDADDADDADDAAIARLRQRLAELGDSVVVVGGEGLWNVHVHVDDVGAAIEAGIDAGRPHRIRVTHFADQIGAHEPAPRVGRSIVAVAAGPGLAALFEEAGAAVVRGGPGERPSTGALLEAIVGCGAQEVVVLPNDHDTVRSAQVAASTAEADHGLRVVVIPTTAQVQGLAAMAVHEPARPFEQDVLEMTATARGARQGAVTVAAKRAMTMAGLCEPGDVLGVVGGDFVVVGQDMDQIAREVLQRLLGGGGELVTLVSGRDDANRSLANACAAWLDEEYPAVEVVLYDGGQERYPLLVAVE